MGRLGIRWLHRVRGIRWPPNACWTPQDGDTTGSQNRYHPGLCFGGASNRRSSLGADRKLVAQFRPLHLPIHHLSGSLTAPLIPVMHLEANQCSVPCHPWSHRNPPPLYFSPTKQTLLRTTANADTPVVERLQLRDYTSLCHSLLNTSSSKEEIQILDFILIVTTTREER